MLDALTSQDLWEGRSRSSQFRPAWRSQGKMLLQHIWHCRLQWWASVKVYLISDLGSFKVESLTFWTVLERPLSAGSTSRGVLAKVPRCTVEWAVSSMFTRAVLGSITQVILEKLIGKPLSSTAWDWLRKLGWKSTGNVDCRGVWPPALRVPGTESAYG